MRNIETYRFTPEPLQVIEATRLIIKDMHHEIAVINQNPFGVLITFHARRGITMTLQLLNHFVGDRLHLSPICAGTDDEEIGKAGDTRKIENDNIFSLFVRGELGAGRG